MSNMYGINLVNLDSQSLFSDDFALFTDYMFVCFPAQRLQMDYSHDLPENNAICT